MRISHLVPSKFDGNRPSQVAGIIRPGIRKLTNEGRSNPAAVKVYRDLIATDATYEAIGKAIADKTGRNNLFAPSNAPFLTVRGGDCVVPEVATKILAMYGEETEVDGASIRVVRRLPIHLFSDEVSKNLDFEYKSFTAAGIQRWSSAADTAAPELGVAVGDHVCKTLVSAASTGAKKARAPGGRDVKVLGRCRPAECAEYGAGKCQMRGDMFFYIEGINIAAPFKMPTGSKVFGLEGEKTLDLIRDATGGNLTRFESPVFFLTKKPKKLSVDGVPKTVNIVVVEAMADIPKLRYMQSQGLLANEGQRSADNAARALGVTAPTSDAEAPDQSDHGDTPHEADDRLAADASVLTHEAVVAETVATRPAMVEATAEAAAISATATATPTPTLPATVVDAPVDGASLQQAVGMAAKAAGFREMSRVKAFASERLGDDWIKNPAALKSMAETLRGVAALRVQLLKSLAESGLTLETFMEDDPEPPFWDFDPAQLQQRLSPVAQ
jgi:hypothetical protein